MPRLIARYLGLVSAACLLACPGCAPSKGPTAPAAGADVLKIGAYSVVREAFHDGLLPAFAASWKAKTGKDLTFEESYNASGAEARSIASGLDSDIAVLSHEGDMETLVKAGKVKPDWNTGPNHGIVSNSIVVIGYRPENPKKIADWVDLARPGVGVLYPDPKTSGGARWNINAIYGAALLQQGDHSGDFNKLKEPERAAVLDLLTRVQANVVNMDSSGRQSMANFERGTGDTIVTYENEILLRKKEGKAIPYVVPPATLLIESPGAIVETSVAKHGNRALAEAFLAFVLAPEGQKILVDYGFRPISSGEAKPDAATPRIFRMNDIGGWPAVQDALYGPKGHWTAIFLRGKQGG